MQNHLHVVHRALLQYIAGEEQDGGEGAYWWTVSSAMALLSGPYVHIADETNVEICEPVTSILGERLMESLACVYGGAAWGW